MRILVFLLFVLSAGAIQAQEMRRLAPDQQAETPEQLAKMKTARFDTYRQELRKAFDAGQVSAVVYFQQKILEFVRNEASYEAATPTAYQQKMRDVLSAFEGFSFDPQEKDKARPKFVLIDEVWETLKKAE